ncbi:hypothetical protein [Streptomyces sp. DH37]|uniref:hypothetical protein n=1 Tax=Streptomyces sp. DH37 TaxID=3040122 RepID=UPI002441E930|nr:hypothetical protein [Streptomyces sp. DH37]MDG9701195.1 hypothetical protein [Streptomyces sp. DH37]
MPRNNNDRIWMDVNVVAAQDIENITLHNGFNGDVNDHVFDHRYCRFSASTVNIGRVLDCKKSAQDPDHTCTRMYHS